MKYKDKVTGAILEPAVSWVEEMYSKNPDFVPVVEKKQSVTKTKPSKEA